MKPAIAYDIVEKTAEKEVFNWKKFVSEHSEKQRLYINSTARSTMAYGAKRSGKTLASTSLIAKMDAESESSARIEIASATIEKSKMLYWRNLEILNKKLGLKWEFKSGQNRIITPKRDIIFKGLRDIPSADMSVGFSVLAVFIDEIQTIREKVFKHYLENIIRINTLNIEGARINFTMNPPVFPLPYLDKALYNNKQVFKVHFLTSDNPWISKEVLQEFLEKEAKELGFDSVEEALEQSNEMKRNVLGLWCPDTGRIIFQQDRISKYKELPHDCNTFKAVIGVDIGGGRARDAIVACIYSKYDKKVYVAEELELETAGEDVENLATRLKYFYEKYKPHAIHLDYGGTGARIANVLSTRYGVPNVVPAIKKDKIAWLEVMRTEAYRGRLLFGPKSELFDEFSQIIYTPDFQEIDDNAGLHSDLLDACLYSFRGIYNLFPEPVIKEKTYEEKRIEDLIKKNKKYGKGKIGI